MTASKQSKSLPGWDLSDLYASPDAKEVAADLKKARRGAEALQKTYEGGISGLDGDGLAELIRTYESLEERLGKLASYAQLLYAGNMTDGKRARFYQDTMEAVTDISAHILFLTLEMNRLPDKKLAVLLKESAKLRHYAPWIEHVRTHRPYQLSDELEKFIHDKSVTGHAAWSRLFDETIAALRFPYEGRQLTEPEIMDLMSSKDAAARKKAAKSVGKVFGEHAPVFTMITNVLAKDKEIEDRWRGYAEPISSRNVANRVEDDVTAALLATVRKNFPALSHRYYRIKASWFGKRTLDYWDRNAPLPEDGDRKWKWEEARSIVLEAYAAFSPEMAKIGKRFFDENWIDVPVRPGKAPGAFAHPTVPSAHPYLLLNYQGKTRDVMTLAHELGHGVHQVLAGGQGALMADTPLTLAETASVFGEMLTFQEILRREKKQEVRRILIAGKVEDMLNTVVRQAAFCEFEQRVHTERRKGELSTERLNEIWLSVQGESLGPALKFHPEYGNFWMYIPHFIHSAFYVYAYAFGDCLVNALYAQYQKERDAGQAKGFEKKYLAMLAAGGTLHHRELLAPFGLDISRPAFWQQGLDIISGYIDMLE